MADAVSPSAPCPNCEVLPGHITGPGTLYLWCPLGHSRKKLAERAGDDLFNSSVLVRPNGETETYRKVHLFYEETTLFTPGDLGFPVFDVETRDGTPYRLGMMVCFDWYFPEAARSLARDAAAGRVDPDAVDEEAFDARLFTADTPDPDLLIRTSGEMRISNFLLWQLAYTELLFTETLWPDFGEDEFDRAVAAFARRERRFGTTG